MSPTGSATGQAPQPIATAAKDWSQNPYVQTLGGFLGGLALGLVPYAGAGQQLADKMNALPHGSTEARRGMAVGQILGGIFTAVGGVAGEIGGGIAGATGIGAKWSGCRRSWYRPGSG